MSDAIEQSGDAGTVSTEVPDWETIVDERSAVLGGLTIARESLLLVTSTNGVDTIERRFWFGRLMPLI